MKGSDSTNSLTELTAVEECFICLMHESPLGEPLVTSKLLRTCGCKFAVHPACWNEWMKDKTDYDCPICRKANLLRINIPPNPVLMVEMPAYPRQRYRISRFQLCAVTLILAFAIAIVVALLY